MCEVEYTDEFEVWWRGLTQAQQEALDDRVMLLAEVEPALKHPVVGDVVASRHKKTREHLTVVDGLSRLESRWGCRICR